MVCACTCVHVCCAAALPHVLPSTLRDERRRGPQPPCQGPAPGPLRPRPRPPVGPPVRHTLPVCPAEVLVHVGSKPRLLGTRDRAPSSRAPGSASTPASGPRVYAGHLRIYPLVLGQQQYYSTHRSKHRSKTAAAAVTPVGVEVVGLDQRARQRRAGPRLGGR